ncbi:PiggyBac transposable element-derived protein 4-like, partial [Elysia marginata]
MEAQTVQNYNASKPHKYHIKTFGLCDSATGYCINILIYFGKDTSYNPDMDPEGSQAVKVFDYLMTPLVKGHHIFADRYYTSYPLLLYLTNRKTYFTGTLNANRKNFPPELKSLSLNHRESKYFLEEKTDYL